MNSLAKLIIQTLEEQQQMDLLPELVDDLQKELYRSTKVTLISAKKLTGAEHEQLKSEVTKRWGTHDIITTVDPALLSGTILRFGHEVVDRSGRSRLIDLSDSLT